MNAAKTEPVYDVVIIGSGAAGGMAAWNLTRQGVNVLVLDAGERFDRAKFWTHVKPWQAMARHERGQNARNSIWIRRNSLTSRPAKNHSS